MGQNVQERIGLVGLGQALAEGSKIHGFLSGGGLRVVIVKSKQKLRGYGEHPSVDEALIHANEDFLAGGRPYKEVYGKVHTHYLTGSRDTTSPLDAWLRQGNTFDAYRVGENQIVVDLKGLVQTQTPEDIRKKVLETHLPISWNKRGYTFETVSDRFPNSQLCTSTKVIDMPRGRPNTDPWFYHIVKTGKGENFYTALEKALEAKEVEIPED